MAHTYKLNSEGGGHEFTVEADGYSHREGYFHFNVVGSGNVVEPVFSVRDSAVTSIRRS